ncbi:hypothetical protein CB1_000626003 [Camelus ferus]|nr:hypothetical protein CB1_000626003 [Camelus ferus]
MALQHLFALMHYTCWNTDERDEPKATISRYRSDDTLDRISDRNDAAKTYKANTLDNRLTNRQSWFPPPPPGYNVTPSTGSSRRKQDLNGLIKVNPETNKNIKRGQSLDNLIKVSPEVNRGNPRSKDLDNLIKANPRTGNNGQGNQDLDKLIKVNPETLTNNRRNQDLDNLIKVNPEVIRNNQSQALDSLTKVKPSALRDTKRDQNLENLIEVNSNMSKNKNGKQDGQVNGSTDALNNLSSKAIAYSYEAKKTRRSVIERDMCTYCRKPLGTETKMILDELQICCHSTCFKVRCNSIRGTDYLHLLSEGYCYPHLPLSMRKNPSIDS